MSDFELEVFFEIEEYMVQNDLHDLYEATIAFWNERLN